MGQGPEVRCWEEVGLRGWQGLGGGWVRKGLGSGGGEGAEVGQRPEGMVEAGKGEQGGEGG